RMERKRSRPGSVEAGPRFRRSETSCRRFRSSGREVCDGLERILWWSRAPPIPAAYRRREGGDREADGRHQELIAHGAEEKGASQERPQDAQTQPADGT